MKKSILILLLLVAIFISGCTPKPGTVGVVTKEFKAISDWDAPVLVKPTCVFNAGEEVVYIEESSVYFGAGYQQQVYHLRSESCDAWPETLSFVDFDE